MNIEGVFRKEGSLLIWVYGLRVTGYGLRVAGYGLRVAGCGLRVTGCGLRVTGCGLRVTGLPWLRRKGAQGTGAPLRPCTPFTSLRHYPTPDTRHLIPNT
ncbi:MAG: hypothetical protein FJY11_04995 [Bacteroidetes bacterium]|nr:hypothetical protein [Bacteroidota bacterium]